MRSYIERRAVPLAARHFRKIGEKIRACGCAAKRFAALEHELPRGGKAAARKFSLHISTKKERVPKGTLSFLVDTMVTRPNTRSKIIPEWFYRDHPVDFKMIVVQDNFLYQIFYRQFWLLLNGVRQIILIVTKVNYISFVQKNFGGKIL